MALNDVRPEVDVGQHVPERETKQGESEYGDVEGGGGSKRNAGGRPYQ